MKKNFVYMIILILSLFLGFIYCDYDDETDDKKKLLPLLSIEVPIDELAACQNNDDCINVPKNCCGCTMGGENFSINKKYENYWNNKKISECYNTLCTAVYTCDQNVVPQCVSKKCELVNDQQE